MGRINVKIDLGRIIVDVYANELSITAKTLDDRKNVVNLIDIYRELKSRGISTCRIATEDYTSLLSSIKNDASKRNLLSFIYAFLRAPYEGSVAVLDSQDEYFEHDWRYQNSSCFGLAMSYLTDSMTISFDEALWGAVVTIRKDDDDVEVRNVSNLAHFECHQEWFESLKAIELQITSIAIEDKCISLRDDHGSDVLYEFAKKICRSPYVEGVVNSLPFNPKEKKFIRRVREHGLVECVLNWTDAGYGMVIKTTGRNIRETEIIAKQLEKEYS